WARRSSWRPTRRRWSPERPSSSMAATPRSRGDHAMIRVLKPGKSEAEKFDADRQVRQTVEAILEDIIARGDAAVRELSAKFDKWEPADFRLSRRQIDALVASLPTQVIDDIKFAQAQI